MTHSGNILKGRSSGRCGASHHGHADQLGQAAGLHLGHDIGPGQLTPKDLFKPSITLASPFMVLPPCGASEGGAGPPSLKLLGLVGVGLPGHRAVRLAVGGAGVLTGQLLVHDRADRGGAAATLGTAAEIAVDLGWGAGAIRAWVQAGTHRAIREDVA